MQPFRVASLTGTSEKVCIIFEIYEGIYFGKNK